MSATPDWRRRISAVGLRSWWAVVYFDMRLGRARNQAQRMIVVCGADFWEGTGGVEVGGGR